MPEVLPNRQARKGQIGGNHYSKMAIQPLEFSYHNNLDALQHTIIKYVCRFRDKGGMEDLEKAKHTIDILMDLEYASSGDHPS